MAAASGGGGVVSGFEEEGEATASVTSWRGWHSRRRGQKGGDE